MSAPVRSLNCVPARRMEPRIRLIYFCLLLVALCLTLPNPVAAEPYMAVRTGLKCMMCHTNPTGGGQRSVYGNAFAQTQLSARTINPWGGEPKYWTGVVNRYLSIGGDIRTGAYGALIDNQDDQFEFDVDEVLLYANLSLIPDFLSIYLDQQVAPGTTNRESYLRVDFSDRMFHAKVGKFFLPYGLRLEDDTAFVRRIPGINYNTPDEGVEVGVETGSWSAQLAVTNGTAGGAETDTGKQYSLHASFTRPFWRVGASFNYNDSDAGDRQMQNVYTGLRTGPIAWLAEVDYVIDKGTPTGRRESWMGLAEANWEIRKGHNLKLTYEHFDPDDDVSEDEQNRYSFVYEYFPFQFTQFRLGVREYDGIEQNDLQNQTEYFLELHGYF